MRLKTNAEFMAVMELLGLQKKLTFENAKYDRGNVGGGPGGDLGVSDLLCKWLKRRASSHSLQPF